LKAAAIALALSLIASPTLAVEVAIVEPAGDRPVFGEIEVAAEVTSREPVVAVSLFVDGVLVEELRKPPWKWSVDLGRENAEHRLQVVAESQSGALSQAALQTPAFRVDMEVEVELQQVYVTASLEDQRIMDLKKEDFTVLDDGQEQVVVTFERGDVPMTAVLLVDASVSMRGARLAAALRGARQFIGGMTPLDQVRLLLFSDRLLHAAPFTNFPEVLFAGLSGVRAEGGTALNDHLYGALKELEERPGRRVVILLSDGVDTASVLRMRDVVPGVRRSGALIYWIRTGKQDPQRQPSSAWRNASSHQEEQQRLQRAVEESGGRGVNVENVEASQGAYEGILAELRDKYVLGFYPKRDLGEGSWHDLKVKTRRSGAQIRTSEGYVDW